MAFKLNEAVRDTAIRIIEANRDTLGHIAVEEILFLNSDGKKLVSDGSMRPTKTMKIPAMFQTILAEKYQDSKAFVIVIYQNVTENYTDKQFLIALYSALRHISEDGDLQDFDVAEWSEIMGAFGTNWTKQNINLPDITDIEANWQNRRQVTLESLRGGRADDAPADPNLALDEQDDEEATKAATGGGVSH